MGMATEGESEEEEEGPKSGGPESQDMAVDDGLEMAERGLVPSLSQCLGISGLVDPGLGCLPGFPSEVQSRGCLARKRDQRNKCQAPPSVLALTTWTFSRHAVGGATGRGIVRRLPWLATADGAL